MNKLNKTLLVTALTLTSSFSIVGCSKKEEVKQTDTTETKTQDKKETLKSIGIKTDTSTEIKLTNKTGQDITTITVIKADGSESENVLEEAFANEEARNFYYEVEQGQTYDVKINTADAEYVLHGFPMDAKEVTIVVADGMAYVDYKDANGQSQSTKDKESALVQETQVTQQQPVQQAPVQQAPAQQAPAQEVPVQEAPVQQAPAVEQAPTAEEGCLSGLFD